MGAGQTTTTRTGRGRAVPWAVLGLWVAVLALVGPFAAKLADVQHDRVTDYLPASADSTQVAKIQEQMPGGDTTEMVLVYHRDGGLSAADRETAAGQVAEIGRQHELIGGAPKGIPSKDGTTLMYPVASNEPGTNEDLRDKLVGDVREVAQGEGGLSVEVGGTGALATDAAKVYDSLGGPLLYTTVAVVAVLLILIYRSPVLWLVPLVVAGIADYMSMGVAYGLNQAFGTTVSGQSSGRDDDPRVRGGHGLRAAARLALPGGTAAHRAPVRGHGRRPARLRARRARLLRHRRRRTAVPARRRPQQQPGHGPARHGRRAVRADRDADPAPRHPRTGRTACVLAARARASGASPSSGGACSRRWAAPPDAGR